MKSRVSVSGAVGVLLLSPFAASAQTVIKATPRTSNTAGGNMCMQLASGPSRLLTSPEGMAVIKMRAELEAVERAMRADTIQMRSDTNQMRQIVIVRGRVDSLGRMIAGEPANRFFFESRPGVPITVDGQLIDPSDPQRLMVSAKLRELQPQIAELSRGGMPPIIGTVSITLNTLGYIGVSATAGTFPTSIDPMRPFAYCEYPRVESVEAGSPADKAGLIAGDTLIAYNNRDLRQTNVNYPDLLIPGKPLNIRFRRDGRVLNTSMVVAARDPEHARMLTSVNPCTEAEMASTGCRREGGALRVTGSPVAAAGPRAAVLSFDGNGGLKFLGASLQPLDEQTAQNLGMDAGLMIFNLASTTPAYQQGLRSGDRVVSANGFDVHDVNTFFRAFTSKSAERAMTLQVTSKIAGARTLIMKW